MLATVYHTSNYQEMNLTFQLGLLLRAGGEAIPSERRRGNDGTLLTLARLHVKLVCSAHEKLDFPFAYFLFFDCCPGFICCGDPFSRAE